MCLYVSTRWTVKTDKVTLFVYSNFLVLLSTTVWSQNINKQNVSIEDETLTDYSFLSRYHYTKSKNYLKRLYQIRHWIPMFIGTPCIYMYIYMWQKKLLPLNKKNKNESSKDLKQNLICSIIFRWFWLYCNWSYEGDQDFRGGGGSTSSPAGTGVHKDRRGNIYFVFLKFKNRNICNNHFNMRVWINVLNWLVFNILQAKSTYGTGCFMLYNTGNKIY